MDKSHLSKICEKLTDEERKAINDSKGWGGPEWFHMDIMSLIWGKDNG